MQRLAVAERFEDSNVVPRHHSLPCGVSEGVHLEWANIGRRRMSRRKRTDRPAGRH
jgi:hypothetical protein